MAARSSTGSWPGSMAAMSVSAARERCRASSWVAPAASRRRHAAASAACSRAPCSYAPVVSDVAPPVALGVLGPLGDRPAHPLAGPRDEDQVEARVLLFPGAEGVRPRGADRLDQPVQLVELGGAEARHAHPEG